MPLNRRQIVQLARLIEERREALLAEIRSGLARAREERLNAQPGAARCLECQQRYEKTYRT